MDWQTIKSQIHGFLEEPETRAAKIVRNMIVLIIILASIVVMIEIFFRSFYKEYEKVFMSGEWVIVILFALEYTGRFLTASNRLSFALTPLNIIDLMSFLPFLIVFGLAELGLVDLRGIVVIFFMLRLGRLVRVLRLLHYKALFHNVIQYRGTILERITHVIFIFLILKIIMWVIESHQIWNPAAASELIAIGGFILGIVLAHKLSYAYDKYKDVESAVFRLAKNTFILANIFEIKKKEVELSYQWLEKLIKFLESREITYLKAVTEMQKINKQLFIIIDSIEKPLADIMNVFITMLEDAEFCLMKKFSLTPRPYEQSLHLSLFIYFAILAVFIPAFVGLISVLVGTIILYSLYHLTHDLDSVFGEPTELINVDLSDIKSRLEQVGRL